jgi:hypothetical protein
MGIFLRKSFGSGPLRFNISKSGIGLSTGVKGFRVGIGPRGVGISGGRHGIYFRKSLNLFGGRSGGGSRQIAPADLTASPSTPWGPGKSFQTGERPLKPGQKSMLLAIVAVIFLVGFGGLYYLVNPYASLPFLLAAGLVLWRTTTKRKRFRLHESILGRLTIQEDPALLNALGESARKLKKPDWRFRHEFIYAKLFDAALEDGVDSVEMTWLSSIAKVLSVDAAGIHEAKISERMWEFMADGAVSPEEEKALEELLQICKISADRLQAEKHALRQFVIARSIQGGKIPTIEPDISLQRDEVCHHQTVGALLENRVLRTHAKGGVKHKEEGLVVTKEGRIYVTSKRILIVGDGTSSIQHTKILELEMDADNNLIAITEDGREKALFLRVSDLIYTGILLDAIAKADNV